MSNEERKGPGRPKFDPEIKRGKLISVRLTEEEYRKANSMKEFDESLSAFFRKMLNNNQRKTRKKRKKGD